MCDKIVCEISRGTKLRMTKLCVRACVCVTKLCVKKMVKAEEHDTESKRRTPCGRVGKGRLGTGFWSISRCSRMRSEGFSFYFGAGGGDVFARRRFCARNRRQPSAMRSLWPCQWQVSQSGHLWKL